jgi:hypothetical protein
MSEISGLDLKRPNEPPKTSETEKKTTKQTKLRGGLADPTAAKPKEKKASLDLFEIRRREFFGL